jgi:hypothetical protein
MQSSAPESTRHKTLIAWFPYSRSTKSAGRLTRVLCGKTGVIGVGKDKKGKSLKDQGISRRNFHGHWTLFPVLFGNCQRFVWCLTCPLYFRQIPRQGDPITDRGIFQNLCHIDGFGVHRVIADASSWINISKPRCAIFSYSYFTSTTPVTIRFLACSHKNPRSRANTR